MQKKKKNDGYVNLALTCVTFATSNRFPHANSSVLPGAPRQRCSHPSPPPLPTLGPPPPPPARLLLFFPPSTRQGSWLIVPCGSVSIEINCPGMRFFTAYAPGCSSISANRAWSELSQKNGLPERSMISYVRTQLFIIKVLFKFVNKPVEESTCCFQKQAS